MRPILRTALSVALIVASTVLAGCASTSSDTDGFGQPALITTYQDAPNLWEVLADHFDLPDENESRPEVEMQIKWYMTHPLYLQSLAESAKPYLYYIYQQVRLRNLPAELTLLPMIESSFDPYAINQGSGAAGLWQMMPGTASGFGVRVNWWYDGRRDVVASTKAALDYFVHLGRFFNNQWLISIAAYDSGEGTVQDAIEYNRRHGRPTNFWALPLTQETKNYVPKLLALATIIKHPARYSIRLPEVLDAPYLAEVDVGSQIDLASAAKMAGMSVAELSSLNPGFNRWATDPNGNHKLILPVTQVERFERALGIIPPKRRVIWAHYQVQSGDTLGGIAHRFHSSSELIKNTNHLQNDTLHIGQSLLIPTQNSQVTQLVIQHESPYLGKNIHHLPETGQIEHVVTPRENLWTIAKQYHVTPKAIRFWNNLPSNAVTPGMTLIIWPPKKSTPTPPAPKKIASPKTTHHVQTLARGYLVMPGDTWASIATRFHVSVATLHAENPLTNRPVHAGDTLLIP